MSISGDQDGGTVHELLDRVTIVLVATTHPGNIGAAARAMKTMGLQRLALVAPKIFPSAEATARASGADDILVQASVHADLASALQDIHYVVGTSARARHLEWPIMMPRAAAEWLAGVPSDSAIAFVFGREHSGLSNTELELCQRVIRIPSSPSFSSLNLAQAVQLCAYELRLAALDSARVSHSDREARATAREREHLFEHLTRVMTTVGYRDPRYPRLLARRLRRLINRVDLTHSEVQIWRGFLTAIEQRVKGK